MRDGVILRLIGKWLNAGVGGRGSTPEHGTPQGGVVAPAGQHRPALRARRVVRKEVRPRLKGGLPDPLCGRLRDRVAREDDARRIMEVLPKRISKYGLTVHPEKTRVVRFHPAEADDSATRGGRKPLAPGHSTSWASPYWGRSFRRADGWSARKTAKSRLKRAFQTLSEWCRHHLHRPIAVQHQKLTQKLQGHYAYYGITGNFHSLQEFLEERERSGDNGCRGAAATAKSVVGLLRLEKRYGLPRARVIHSVLGRAAKS